MSGSTPSERSTWRHGQNAGAPSASTQRPHATAVPRGERDPGELLGESGLADARLADAQDEPAGALAGGVEPPPQRVELHGAVRRCRRPCRAPGPVLPWRMRLYLVQHGQAKTEEEDPERSLTVDGVDGVGRVARQAVDWLGVRVDRVVHSGKTRARQTAEIWGGLLDSEVEQADALAPNDDSSTWVARLDAQAGDLMLVGHLPHLARLAGLLLTGAPPTIP